MNSTSKHHVNNKEMEQEFQIIERAKHDIDAFEPLYNKYYNEIKKCVENTLFVHYTIKNEEVTKDITSTVFATAIIKLHQYKTIHGIPFKSWLYRIMQNEIAGYIRKVAVREKHEKNIEQCIPKYDEIALGHNTDEPKLNYLKKCIPNLASNEQLLIQYRFFDNYSYKEISKIMGLSENSLRTRMTRLLKKIQTFIEKKGA